MLHSRSAFRSSMLNRREVQYLVARQALSRIRGRCQITTHERSGLVGGGPDFEGYLWLAGLARSLAPVMKKLAITDTDRLDLGTLTDRLRQDAIAKGAVVWMPSLVGAYAHRP